MQNEDTENAMQEAMLRSAKALERKANQALAQRAVEAYKAQEEKLKNPLYLNRATINVRLTEKLKSKGWAPNAMLKTALDPTHPLFEQIGIK